MALLKRRENRLRHPVYPDNQPRMQSLQDEMNRLLGDFLRGVDRPFLTAARPGGMGDFVPTVDVTETENDIRIAAELPGMSREDLHVEVEDDLLTISGEKKMAKEEEAGNRTWNESTYGSFLREVHLPDSVQPDKAKASYRDGILRVIVPRSEESRTRRRSVPIQAA